MRRLQEQGERRLAVAFSMGKDSLVVLDLLMRNGFTVWPYYLEASKLDFVERRLASYERFFEVAVHRYPHPDYAEALRTGQWRQWTPAASAIGKMTHNALAALVRLDSGCEYIASGERRNDSFVRRGMLKHSDGIDPKRRRVFLVQEFTRPEIMAYLRARRVPLSSDYDVLGHSFQWNKVGDLVWLRQAHPTDFAKLERLFPHLPALMVHHAKQQA